MKIKKKHYRPGNCHNIINSDSVPQELIYFISRKLKAKVETKIAAVAEVSIEYTYVPHDLPLINILNTIPRLMYEIREKPT